MSRGSVKGKKNFVWPPREHAKSGRESRLKRRIKISNNTHHWVSLDGVESTQVLGERRKTAPPLSARGGGRSVLTLSKTHARTALRIGANGGVRTSPGHSASQGTQRCQRDQHFSPPLLTSLQPKKKLEITRPWQSANGFNAKRERRRHPSWRIQFHGKCSFLAPGRGRESDDHPSPFGACLFIP